jgi:hypothetical protein
VTSRLIFTLLAAAAPAAAPLPPAPAAQATPLPTPAQVLGNVRRAVGYAALARLPVGFSLTETVEPGGRRETTSFGTRRGALRVGNDYGYDGAWRWRFDERRGIAVPAALRLHEKTAWPLWVRGYWWLSPASGFAAAIDPTQTNAREVALTLSEPGGLIAATVVIDRATWQPLRLSIPYERGPFTAAYSDYRPALGALFPFTVETRYGSATVRHIEKIEPLAAAAADFAAAPPPPPVRFDPFLPAALSLRRGTPFGPRTPGHLYVPAAVDGTPSGLFLIDSGADGMMIDSALADRLGLPVVGRTRSMGADGQPREATFRRGRSFTVGRLHFDNPVFLALDLSASNAPAGEKRAGAIGYDVFARAVVEFARGGERVAICDPATYRLPAPGRWQRLDFIDQAPAVTTRLEGGRSGLFQIDTGAAGAVDFYRQYVEAEKLLAGRETREVESSGAGGAFRMRAGRMGWIELGGRRFTNVEAGFRSNLTREGGAGVIGRELMAPFLVVFDYPHRRIAFVDATRARPASGCR